MSTTRKTKKPRETYRETYLDATIRKDLLPERFPFTSKGWQVDAIEVMAAGVLEDGREFQEIRIYTRKAAPEQQEVSIPGESLRAGQGS